MVNHEEYYLALVEESSQIPLELLVYPELYVLICILVEWLLSLSSLNTLELLPLTDIACLDQPPLAFLNNDLV